MICQASISKDGLDAWHECAALCDQKAVATVTLTLVPLKRWTSVRLCQEHLDEFQRAMEAA